MNAGLVGRRERHARGHRQPERATDECQLLDAPGCIRATWRSRITAWKGSGRWCWSAILADDWRQPGDSSSSPGTARPATERSRRSAWRCCMRSATSVESRRIRLRMPRHRYLRHARRTVRWRAGL